MIESIISEQHEALGLPAAQEWFEHVSHAEAVPHNPERGLCWPRACGESKLSKQMGGRKWVEADVAGTPDTQLHPRLVV